MINLRSVGRLTLLALIGGALTFLSCKTEAPAPKHKPSDNSKSSSTTEHKQRTDTNSAQNKTRSAKDRGTQKSAGVCKPDTRGRRNDLALRAKLGNQLDRIWARERALVIRKDWQPFMPSGDGTADLKLISFEMANRAEAGHHLPNFKCVRLRFWVSENRSQ